VTHVFLTKARSEAINVLSRYYNISSEKTDQTVNEAVDLVNSIDLSIKNFADVLKRQMSNNNSRYNKKPLTKLLLLPATIMMKPIFQKIFLVFLRIPLMLKTLKSIT